MKDKIKSFLSGFYGFIFRIIMTLPFEFIRRLWLKFTLSKFGSGTFVMSFVEFISPWKISIGNNCVINKDALLDGRGGLYIGNNVDIAREAIIWTCTHDISDLNHTIYHKSVVIEDYVWIGARATILPGIKIGRGAVIGTCAVVTKDVPPCSVVAGNPARIIGKRENALMYTLDHHPWFI